VPASFFQSWTWVGCLAAERFPDPIVLRAERQGVLVGLALFNRRRGRLHLGESGDAALDRPFVEHNGPLADGPAVAEALLRAAWKIKGIQGLVLGGVPPSLVAAAGGIATRRQDRPAPVLDLAALRATGVDILDCLSANTRQQIRRSDRHFGGEATLRIEAAAGRADLDAWFPDLVALNDATWAARGQPGAFATDYLRRFHRSLMEQALARDELDLLRVTAGRGLVGFLYNLRFRGVSYAYQSGLTGTGEHRQAKPGMTCHALAIRRAVARGDAAYDFLAGDQRYKRSFAPSGTTTLCWAELARGWSAAGAFARLRHWAGRGAGNAGDG
jgi:CelD/BcsL family acetyltransferase involved in cellulose biosynthesis